MARDHDLPSGSHAFAAGSVGDANAPGDLPAAGADALSDVLEAVRLTGALFFLVDAHEPWIAEAPDAATLAPVILPRAQHVVSYHLITEGTCWCHMDGLAPVRLDAGDIVVVPHGDAYQLSSHPAPSSTGLSLAQILEWFQMMAAGRLPFVVEEGGDLPQRVGVVCGFLGCDALPFNPVLSTLPRLLPLRRTMSMGRDRLATLIDFAVGEAQGQREGRRSILLRLSELMFVEVVRRYLMTVRRRRSAAGSRGCAIRWSGARWRGSTPSPGARGRSRSSPARSPHHAPCSPNASRIWSASRRCTTSRAGGSTWRRRY